MTKAPGFNLNWPRKKNNYFYPTNLFIWNQISITTGAKSKACSDIHWSWDGKKQRWLGNWRSVKETFTAMLNCLITTCNTSNNNWKCIPLLCQSLSDGLSPSQKLSTQTSIQWDCHIHLFTKLFFLTNWSLPKPILHAKISVEDGCDLPNQFFRASKHLRNSRNYADRLSTLYVNWWRTVQYSCVFVDVFSDDCMCMGMCTSCVLQTIVEHLFIARTEMTKVLL